MATITVNYTANYAGDHRICYRQVGTADYCCLTDTVAAVGPVTFVIDFATPADYCFGTPDEVVTPVETDCGPFAYEGYIQPTCETIDSVNNRTAWTASFTTTPDCNAYTVTCASSGIAGIQMITGGNTYLTIPSYVISGAGGATLALHVYVTSAAINAGGAGSGAGYTNGDVLTVAGGTGTAAQVTVQTVDGGGGILTYITSNIGNYTVIPASPNAVTGGTGAGATFDLEYGVLSCDVTAPGTYTTSIPTITFDLPAGLGTRALGTVLMEPCAAFIPPTCALILDDGVPDAGLTLDGLTYLSAVDFCSKGAAPVIAGYTVAPSVEVTCCSCRLLTINVINGVVPYVFYTDAITHDVTYLDNGGLGFSGAQTIVSNVSAVDNSWGCTPGVEDQVEYIDVVCL